MTLAQYKQKRNFRVTSEPAGGRTPRDGWLFVIQKHDATHLHYDFRLQLGGVLLSWAVPKGPSLNPKTKRLAVHVEDHPVEYGGFEGIIPQGQYGGGTVMLWDRGDWVPVGDPEEGYRKGHLKFTIHGQKLHGGWVPIRKGGAKDTSERNWFLVKERDEFAIDDSGADVVDTETRSVASDRTMDEIADQRKAVWHSSRKEQPQEPQRKAEPRARQSSESTLTELAEATTGAAKRRMAKSVVPQLATLVDQPPEGHEWLHEIKFDGYRMICHVTGKTVRFISRSQQDWTDKFGHLAELVRSIPVESAILDGEVVVMDSAGVSRFQLLQNAFKTGQVDSAQYLIFDLLYLNGIDLTGAPLEQRKELLSVLLREKSVSRQISYSDHVVGNGDAFFSEARKQGLEGIISKRKHGHYVAGRTHDWLKTKCIQTAEFVIGGYTEPGGARNDFGALLIGYFDESRQFVYAGKVGTGFSRKSLASMAAQFRSIAVDKSPFVEVPREAARKAHWIKPQIVVQIEFTEWTSDGRLRHPAFVGVREDKAAQEVTRDRPTRVDDIQSPAKGKTMSKRGRRTETSDAPAQKVQDRSPSPRHRPTAREQISPRNDGTESIVLSHPEKVLYPNQKITKLDIARYFSAVQEWLLPHTKDRLAVLVRCPDGIAKETFYQKHPGKGTPEFITQFPVVEKNATANYVVLDSPASLTWAVQMAVLEIHLWGSRIDDIEKPDRLIFDLDPDPQISWQKLVESARQIKEFLGDLGFETFLKTTGGKGLHIVVPVQRRATWDEVKQFCHGVVSAIELAAPGRYTSNMSKAARQGKIFVDYLRNQRGATSIAPYSTRARDGAPVSVPIDWKELDTTVDVRSAHFNINNVPDRLSKLKHDPWESFGAVRQSITAAAKKKLGL